MDPDAYLRQQTERFTQLREQAEQVRAQLAENTVTVSDGRDTVTVQVGAGGVMQSLRFGPRATSMPASQLAAAVMKTYGRACREAASRSQEILGQLVGENSPTLQLMRDAVPPDAEAEEVDGPSPRGSVR